MSSRSRWFCFLVVFTCTLLVTPCVVQAQGKQDSSGKDEKKDDDSGKNAKTGGKKGNRKNGNGNETEEKAAKGQVKRPEGSALTNDSLPSLQNPADEGLSAAARIGLRPTNRLIAFNVTPFNGAYRFEADKSKNGHVTIRLERGQAPRDDLKKKVKTSDDDMCLTTEEVTGQKIEDEILIADGSMALEILPGAVINTDELLRSGSFVYEHMDIRKPFSLSTTSNLAKKNSIRVTELRGGGIREADLRDAVFTLTSPNNFGREMPSASSASSMETSTFQESLGVEVGASFFYMGVGADADFSFSSEKYRYMYLYTFDQVFLPVLADEIRSVDALFSEPVTATEQMAFIREVKYGRRLYVLLESEYDIDTYKSELQGKANWLAVSAALSQSTKGSKLQSQTNLRILTQGGQQVAVTDPAKLQKTIDDYFASKYSANDIVPLSYRLTTLEGQPISLVMETFLNSKNCLKTDRFRVRLTTVALDQTDNGKSQEIYGGANINLYTDRGQKVFPDGRSPVPETSISMSSGSVTFASKDTPLELQPKKEKAFGPGEQGRYLEFLVHDLDMEIEIRPYMKERDSLSDDEFGTNNKFRKSLREILLEGTPTTTFELQTKQTRTRMIFEIAPEF
jgi:Thiol-activated cytolysin